MLGGSWYLVSFHVTDWVSHVDVTGGSSEKNELIGEGSGETQLESDESPTVWIGETYPTIPVARNEHGLSCEHSDFVYGKGRREERTNLWRQQIVFQS